MSAHVYQPGEPINSKWTLDAQLGVGGMGTVFSATHRNGARAALKLLHAEYADDPKLRERFLREGKIANRVDHPARVAVSDDDESDRGEPFLVMELLTGETLSAMQHARGGKLALDEVLRIFDVVLELLAVCHDVGIVHRDIKPANIFLTQRNEVKVLDFGVARMRETGTDATRAGTALGTPAYMAPEQALGQENVDGRADVFYFSVGSCLYFALSGEKLHKGANETESYLMAATRAAPSLANVAPDLPVEVVSLVDRALAYDRNRRFPDARAMRSELLAIAAASRTGNLTAADAPRANAIVVRGEQISSEDNEGEQPEDVDTVRDRVTVVWRLLGVLIANIRQFGWSSPTTTKSLEIATEELRSALAKPGGMVRWEVTAQAFVFDGVPVWTPDRSPFDRIPWQLFADGIRQIQLKRGLADDELRDFIAILTREPTGGDEDDAVTALWDRRFEHVSYFAIDSFAEGDDEGDRETFQREMGALAGQATSLAMVDKDWDVGSLEARAFQANLSAMMKQTSESAAALALDPMTRASLAAQITLAQEVWTERYCDAFVDAYREAVRGGDLTHLADAMREWTRDQLALHNYASAFRMLGSLNGAFTRIADEKTATALERKLRAVMFPSEAIRIVLTDLAREGVPDLDEEIATGLGKALDTLQDDSAMSLACTCLAGTRDDRLRNMLFRYIKRFASAHARTLGTLLPAAAPRVALAVMRLLADQKTPEANAALENVFRNPSIEVRVEALARMVDAPSERIREELGRLFSDSSAEQRAEALRQSARVGLVAAGPILALKIQDPSYHALPLAERKLWFESLAALNPRRADALASELLDQKKIMPAKPIEETRVIAAEVLARSSHADTLKLLERVAGDRWFSSQPVRDAAAKSATEIKTRAKAKPSIAPISRAPTPVSVPPKTRDKS